VASAGYQAIDLSVLRQQDKVLAIQSFREIVMSIEVEWARMTAPDLREIAARKGALAILPAGSLEQHGPHLPVITDTASASAASIAAARLVVEGPGSGAGRGAARPMAGFERASFAFWRHDQRRLCRLSRDP
jgi:creatinine amidohydrolase